jgi:hypothetical protein
VSSDVIIGHDGKPRCPWAGAGDTALGRYHDEVWGARTYDESALFEALALGVFEVGLSWSVVFGKRDACMVEPKADAPGRNRTSARGLGSRGSFTKNRCKSRVCRVWWPPMRQ